MSTSDHAVPVSSPYQILPVSVSIKDEEHLPPMAEEHSFTPGAAPISGQLMTNQAPSSSVTMPSTETPDSQRSDQEARPESDEEQEEQDPQDPIVSFDWAELTGRFQHMVEGRNSEDEKLQNEFDNLVKFFNVWAMTTQTHEVDRSFKRLATRICHVQHSEAQLEKKRQHYMRVVEAFQSALQLLNSH